MSETFVSRSARLGMLVLFLLLVMGAEDSQPASCQSTAVVTIGVAQAREVANGLGFNLDPEQEWQWAAAHAAGAKYARFQCSWSDVERQTPPPENKPGATQYVEDPHCLAGFASAVKYGMHVTVVAAYGPPYHKILTLSIPSGATAGSTSLDVQLESGVGGDSLKSISFPYAYLCPAQIDELGAATDRCGKQVTKRHSYQGALITGIKQTDDLHATLSLASSTSLPLPPSRTVLRGCNIRANSRLLVCAKPSTDLTALIDSQLVLRVAGRSATAMVRSAAISSDRIEVTLARMFPYDLSNAAAISTRLYNVNEVLYPSPGSDKADDPSVVAYSNYVSFLAQDIAAHGVSGEVEIWNEPPWGNDPWDYRPGLYDPGSYSGPAQYGANFGFAANIMDRHFPPGITATWNGTSGNGTASLLSPRMEQYTGKKLVQPSLVITRESFHPYSGDHSNPENTMFVSSCLEKAALAEPGTAAGNPFANGVNCYLPGLDQSANSLLAVLMDLRARERSPSYGIGHSITETNELPPTAGLKRKQAQVILRQFLGFEADGMSPVEFFKFYDRGPVDPSFSFVEKTGTGNEFRPTPAYTALKGLESDLSVFDDVLPDSSKSAPKTAISRYQGTYPIAAVDIVGKRHGTKALSEYFVLWQLTSCTAEKDCWYSLPSPPLAPVQISISANKKISSVINLITRAPVEYKVNGNLVEVLVSDDPIALLVDPR